MPPSSWLELGELGLQPPPTPVSHGIRTTPEGAILRYIQLSAQVDQGASATPGSSGKEELRVWTVGSKSWTTEEHKNGKKGSESVQQVES